MDDMYETVGTRNERLMIECLRELSGSECVGCLKGKMVRSAMKSKIDYHIDGPMDMWVVDVIGPIRDETLMGEKYILVIIDVFTRYMFVSLMRTKGESATRLLQQIRQSQTQLGRTLKRLHSDGGRELVNQEVSNYLLSNGTIQTHTTPHTPQHNGIVERANRTLIEMVKAMMFHCDAYIPLWGEAVKTAAYLLRRSLTQASSTRTPTELWNQRRPSVKHLHVFGCDVYYHVHKNSREGKFEMSSREGIFVGYDEQNEVYFRVYDVDDGKIIVSSDVVFFDQSFKEMKKLKIEAESGNRTHDPPTPDPFSVPLSQQLQTARFARVNTNDSLPDSMLTEEILSELFSTPHSQPDHKSKHNDNTKETDEIKETKENKKNDNDRSESEKPWFGKI